MAKIVVLFNGIIVFSFYRYIAGYEIYLNCVICVVSQLTHIIAMNFNPFLIIKYVLELSSNF